MVANEDAAAVAVESGRDTEATEQALEQAEIAFGGFRKEELGGEDFAGGIVLHAQRGEARAAAFEPVVRAAVQLHELTFAGDARAPLTMNRSAALGAGSRGLPGEEGGAGSRGPGRSLRLHRVFR